MSNLLREYVRSILLEKASPKVSKQPESLNDLCRMLSATGINASSKRGAVNWAGSLDDLDATVKGNGLQLVTNKNGIKTTSADMYTGNKNAILAFIRLSLSIDIGNESVKEVPVIIKPDNALIDPAACANKLKGGTALGYGVEHAIYSGLKGTTSKSMIKAMKEQDARLTKLLAAASNIAPDALDKYLSDVTTMRAAIVKNEKKIGAVSIIGAPPGGGSAEYDIQAVGANDPNHKYVFHAKYKSDRLVGIPQDSSEAAVDPEEIEDKFKGEGDKLPLPVSSNSSIAFKIARDSLLFNSLPKKSLDGNILNNADKQLTPAGKTVHKKQTIPGDDLGVAEINVIMRDKALRTGLFQKMREAGFYDSINGDIKRQLGIDLKPQVGEKNVKKMTSVFINFLSVDNPDIFTFDSSQGASWNFELAKEGGNTARIAFFVTAISGSKRIEEVMEIELGSIKRAKYVQIHKGTGFHAWLDALSEKNKKLS